MGTIDRRLARLEDQIKAPEGELQRWAQREFLKRLTWEELRWLGEPTEQAQSLVPCPRFEPRECGCQCLARVDRGYEEHPELHDEKLRRWRSLYERREEILAREPADRSAEWRRRHGHTA